MLIKTTMIKDKTLRFSVLEKYNFSCVRCNYSENTVSLHIHHLDHNKDNNDIKNLIVLCANCHFSLHYKKWKLADIGIHNQKTKTVTTKRSYNWCTKKKESEYLNEIESLNQKILHYKQHTNLLNERHKFNIIKKTVLIDIFIEYIGSQSFRYREDLVLIGMVYEAYYHSTLHSVDRWSAYKASDDIINIIKNNVDKKIQTDYLYANPPISELDEIVMNGSII